MLNLKAIMTVLFLSLALLFPSVGWDQNNAALSLIQTITLPGVKGRIDHMASDLKRQRLLVAAHDNNTLELIDVGSGRHSGTIHGLDEPQGVLYVAHRDLIIATNGGDGSVRLYDGQSLKQVGSVQLKDDADNIRYDEATEEIYVGYGKGGLAILNPDGQLTASIPLSGHPESFQLQKRGQKIFVNLPSQDRIAVVDRSKRAILASWKLEGAKANYPMALDEGSGRLYIGCRKPSRILVYQIESGIVIASVDISRDSDDMFFDPASKRLYVSSGQGFIHVFGENAGGGYKMIGKIPTAGGARTCLLVPQKNRLYLAVPQNDKRQAEIRVYALKPAF